MKSRFPAQLLFFLLIGVLASTRAHPLDCQCILATSGCNFALFDEAAGKPRHTWYQDFTPPGGQSTLHDRALACWRKRDVQGSGDGLCCQLNNNESDADRYFKGD